MCCMLILLKTLITNLYFLVVELTITWWLGLLLPESLNIRMFEFRLEFLLKKKWRLGRGGGGLFKIKNSTLYLLTIFIKIYG